MSNQLDIPRKCDTQNLTWMNNLKINLKLIKWLKKASACDSMN